MTPIFAYVMVALLAMFSPLRPPPVYTFEVVHTYPHDHTAFTEGLVYDNGFLYEGTGIEGQSDLRKVDLTSGRVLQSRALSPSYFGEGVTSVSDKLIELTWQSQIGFVYDKATFRLLRQFNYDWEGWGLTHDGQTLIISDGTATLHFLDPDSFAELRRVTVSDEYGPVELLNELEYIHGEIYANVWQTDRIARIDPESGQVTGWIDLTGLLPAQPLEVTVDVLNGIAYDAVNDRLFVTGKFWPLLFEIRLHRFAMPGPGACRMWLAQAGLCQPDA